jgi:hypothetical protein
LIPFIQAAPLRSTNEGEVVEETRQTEELEVMRQIMPQTDNFMILHERVRNLFKKNINYNQELRRFLRLRNQMMNKP